MTITCENCQTRFVLDEARIPPQGARVRCSRCQHRFQVKPPPAQPSPEEIVERAVENSAPFDPSGGRETADEAASDARGEAADDPPDAPAEAEAPDGALDNPEFIFDPGGTSFSSQGAPPEEFADLGRDADPLPGANAEVAYESAAVAYEPPREAAPEPPQSPDPTQGSAFDEAELARDESGPPTISGARAELFGAPEEGIGGDAADEGRALEAPLQSAQRSPAGVRGATGATLRSSGPLLDVAPEPAPTPQAWRGYARDVVPARQAPAEAPKPPARRPAEPDVASRAQPGLLAKVAARIAATAVAVALVGGGVRSYVLDWNPEPASVRGEGWIATDLDAFHTHGADGRRVLVIRGSLSAEGSQTPPEVRVELLDARGAAIGDPIPALLLRLDGAALSPRAITTRLAEGPLATRAGPTAGFTILVPDPPPQARRYRLELARRSR
jgi:predicted Zn finger-like uncharacterized protein